MTKSPVILGYLLLLSQLLTGCPSHTSVSEECAPPQPIPEEQDRSKNAEGLPEEDGMTEFDVKTTSAEDLKAAFKDKLLGYMDDFEVNQRTSDGCSDCAIFEIFTSDSKDPKFISKILDPSFVNSCNFKVGINLKGLEAEIVAWKGNAFVAKYLSHAEGFEKFNRLNLAATFLKDLHSREPGAEYEDKDNQTSWRGKYGIDNDVAFKNLKTLKANGFFEKLFTKMRKEVEKKEASEKTEKEGEIELIHKNINYLESLGSSKDFFTTANEGKVSFCHNDLHFGNIFYTSPQSMQAIDWDYAGLNYCLMDLAFFSVWNLRGKCGYETSYLKNLLSTYLNQEPTPGQINELLEAIVFAQGYIGLWLIERYIDKSDAKWKVECGIKCLKELPHPATTYKCIENIQK